MADFDVQGARKAGYSDKEIADHLASTNKFDAEAARKSGYGDKEIIDHLSPGPGLVSRVATAAGDAFKTADDWATTRAANAAGGIASLPGAAAHGVDWLGRKIGIDPSWLGPQYAKIVEAMKEHPTAPQFSSDFLTSINKKPVNLEGNIPGGKIIDTAVEGAMGAAATGGTSLPAVLAGTFGGAGSEIGGQVAQQVAPEYETAFRVGGALLGGGTGAVIPSVVRKTADTSKAAIAPFTAAGRDRIVGQTLVDKADDPAAAIAKMDAYTPPVPGFKVTAAQAAKDDSLLGVQNALDRPGSGFGFQVKGNNATLTQALDALDAGMDPKKFVAEVAKVDAGAAMRAQAALDALPAGTDAATAGQRIGDALRNRFNVLDTARSRAVNPLYAEARAFPDDLRIGPVFQKVDDAIANSKGDIKAAMEKARSLLFNDKGQPDWSGKGMMNARAEIDDMIGKAQPGSNEARLLTGIKAEIDNSLSFIPAEQQARQTFAAMSRPLDPFSADQGAKNVANVLETAPYTNAPVVAAENVPAMFFRPGDAGAASMKEFMAANGGNPGAIDAMRNFIAGQAREATDVKAFLLKNQQAIETLDPALARQLESAAATRSISEGFKVSPAGKFIEGDLDAAVRSTLGAPDSAKRLQAIRMAVGGNPEAVQGMQKSILDDFRRVAGTTVAEDATGTPMLTANGANKWLDANRASVAGHLSPDQMAGLEAIARSLKDQAQTATKVAGSDTGRNLATMSILEAALWKGAGEASWLAPVRKTLGLVYGGANEQAMDRLIEVMRDPKVAAALMKKASEGNVKMVEPLLQSFAKGTAVPALTQGGKGSP